jgi:hypothetical protein
MRQNGGDTGPDIVAANNGRLAHFNAGDICDGIELTGRENANPQS